MSIKQAMGGQLVLHKLGGKKNITRNMVYCSTPKAPLKPIYLIYRDFLKKGRNM